MAHPLHHAESSARKFGGVPSDYQAVHDWFDASKEHLALFTHRALRHHTQGIFEAERVFGLSLTNGAGRDIPVRWIGEQHVREDCRGRIPSLADWLTRIQPEPWMANGRIEDPAVQTCGDPRSDWLAAVDAGKPVHWANEGYRVHRDGLGQYLVTFVRNGSTIGLTDRSGRHLNGAEADFFISEPDRGAAEEKGREVREATSDTSSGAGSG